MRRRGAAASFVAVVLTAALAATAAAAPPGPGLSLGKRFAGLSGTNFVPSQVSGAPGTTRYVHFVNGRGRIFDRMGAVRGTFTLNDLIGAPASEWVVDPQVIWDGQTGRFYFAALWIDFSANLSRVVFGFSRTASPDDETDFCWYQRSFGERHLEDLSLGDSQHFVLIGLNSFDAATSTIQRADVVHFDKPGPGATCPSAASRGIGLITGLRTQGGGALMSPVAVQQVDTAVAGWIVSIPRVPSGGSANRLVLHRVTRDASGDPVIPTNGTDVPVTAFEVPPPADQADETRNIRTGDASLSQAVSALDPLRGKLGIWTAHTVKAGSLSTIRWYEIDPALATLHQNGTVAFAGGFAYIPAIAPDRQVQGGTARFGSNMVMTYLTSSETTHVTMRVAAKRGNGAVTKAVVVTSPGPHADFSCFSSTDACFFGPDGAASPDPVVPASATVGRVWIANQWSNGAGTTNGANWRTRIAAVTP